MDSKSRVIVITGANKGIGFELAKKLLKNTSKPVVVITSRNESLGREAFNQIIELNPSSKELLHYHVLDITKKETYSPFVDWIKATFGKIDVLVNNAGVIADKNELSPDYKASVSDALPVLGTNYIHTREFTDYLLPYLATDGKVINVASTLGKYDIQGSTLHKKLINPSFKAGDLDEVYNLYIEAAKNQNFAEAGITPSPYKVSKALLIAWTYHVLKNKLTGDQQAFTVCPGWCRTDMGGPNATKSAEEGPESIEYLINEPYKPNPETNGRFFSEKKVVKLV